MTDYWGAQAYWSSSPGQDGFDRWYSPPDTGAKVKFTAPPAKNDGGDSVDSGNLPIDVFHQQLENSQPAHLSALADQWQNMHDMLAAIHKQLLDESNTLYDDKWKGGQARDVFMKTGPGPVLAYIDAWKESALANKTALRAIASIIVEYQGKMKPLWTEYKQAVDDAQHVSAYHTALGWLVDYNVFGGSDQPDFDANMARDRIAATKDVQTKYNIRAQAMAWEMAKALFDTYSPLSGGHGPLYLPPDAVIDDPSGLHISGLGPGGAPALPPPPPPPVMPAIASPPPGAVTPPPSVPGTPTVPTGPSGPVTIPGIPVGSTVPSMPGTAAGQPSLPLPLTGPMSSGLGAGLAESGLPVVPRGSGAANPFAAPKVPGSGGLISRSAVDAQGDARLGAAPHGQGVLSKGGGNPARRPAGQPETPGTGRRAGRGGSAEDPGFEREPGQEDLFGGKGVASPPVLGNRRRNRSRSTVPPGAAGDEFSTELPQHGDAVPSVFGRNTLSGAGPAEVDDSAPVLRAPARPVAGADEIPAALRAATGRESAQREIHDRSTGRVMGTARPVTPGEPGEPSAIPTDEEAFSVKASGGGVLTGHQDDRGYSPEPPAQVRGQ